MKNQKLEELLGAEKTRAAMDASRYEHERICRKCQGSGIYWTRHANARDCHSCGSTGSILSERIDRRLYRSNLWALWRNDDVKTAIDTQDDALAEIRIEFFDENPGEIDRTCGAADDGSFRGICGGFDRGHKTLKQ